MISVIIPSRSAQWLSKTVEDLFNKAEGIVEVIVVFDGRWPEPEEMLKDRPNLIQIHHGVIHDNYGMRASINLGVAASKGEYIMKLDEQCAVSQGYDVRLASICQDNWVVIPRRKRLEPETWTYINDGRPDIDYMAVEYPYLKPLDKTQGLHGKEWRRPERAGVEVDDTPTGQGSCYFMSRKHWDRIIGELDSTHYGTFTSEAQEVTLKTWFTGGRVVVDKGSHYAHWHKGSKGKGYAFTNEQYRRHQEGMEKGRLFSIEYWLSTTDFKYGWNWFVTKKFPDMPGWSPDWKERVERDKLKDYSTLKYKDDQWLSALAT